jgi:hypothetical protein
MKVSRSDFFLGAAAAAPSGTFLRLMLLVHEAAMLLGLHLSRYIARKQETPRN